MSGNTDIEDPTACFYASIEMIPAPKGRPRMTKTGHTYTPQQTRNAEAFIKYQLLSHYHGEIQTGPIYLKLHFYLKRAKQDKRKYATRRPDLDNLAKLVMDAGNGILWRDDAQIVCQEFSKSYASSEGSPGIEITVETL